MNNIESRVERAKGLRTHIIRGKINLSDIKLFLANLYRSDGFDPNGPALWDVREADFSAVIPGEIRELACFVRVNWEEKHNRRTALVIAGDFHFGLFRMFEQFVGPPAHSRIKTFRDLQMAIVWIEGKDGAAPHPADVRAIQTGRL